MIFSNIFEPTSTNFIFGKFAVARKLILNGGVIRPTGLLFIRVYSIVITFLCEIIYF